MILHNFLGLPFPFHLLFTFLFAFPVAALASGKENHDSGAFLLFFAWINFIFFLLFVYAFGRKPIAEFLGYRRLTLTKTITEREQEELKLRMHLNKLEEEYSHLPRELEEERNRFWKELEQEVALLRERFGEEAEKLREAYRKRRAISEKEEEFLLLTRVLSALRDELQNRLQVVPRRSLLEAYLRTLKLGGE